MLTTAFNQSIIVFMLLQVLFGFLVFQQEKDLFYAIGRLTKPQYLMPSLAVTVAAFFVNIILRVILSFFS